MTLPPEKQAIVINNTYCPISQEVKAIWQWNLSSQKNIAYETFSLKNQTQNVVEKLSSTV